MPKTNTAKRIIVYADDDQDDLFLVEQAFLDYSEIIELKSFTDGAQVLQYLTALPKAAQTPCLIVLDINMPVMNGKKTFSELKKLKRYSKTPVILFSTSTTTEDKLYALKNGGGYVTKPMNMRQLEEIIKQFVGYCMDKSIKFISNN